MPRKITVRNSQGSTVEVATSDAVVAALTGLPSRAIHSCSAGVSGFTPAATPTDIWGLGLQGFSRVARLRRVSISATADTAAVVDVMLQRSANGGGGTSVTLPTGRHDTRDASGDGFAFYYTANRTSGGNGASSSRPAMRASKLTIGTSTTSAAPVEWVFDGDKAPAINDLVEWLVVNLNGQTLPANTKISVDAEWEERRVCRVTFFGDSTYSNAIYFFRALATGGYLNGIASVDNLGSNGYRLTDFLNNTNGVTYPLTTTLNRTRDVVVIGYGINDVRTGATSQSQLTALLEQAITTILENSPDAKIILHGPNSLTSDDPGATGYVTTTGLFAGMTLAAAAQEATNIMRRAYASFANDPRIYAVVQRQDVTGTTAKTVSASGLMTDILHPNERGQVLIARHLYPTLMQAVEDVIERVVL